MKMDETILILGGAGLVGFQVARAAARELEPRKIVIASLYQREVREAVAALKKEFNKVEWVGVWGDVFLRSEFQHIRKSELLASKARRDELFEDLMGDGNAAYENSRVVQLVREHKPNVIVDSINTATAISYQDVYTASLVAKQRMDAVFQGIEDLAHTVRPLAALLHPAGGGAVAEAFSRERQEHILTELRAAVEHLAQNRKAAQAAFESLLISQGLPQLVRHVILLLRVMDEVGTRLYLKIGTTGTGGMGLNIPYTHGEDKPSAKLMTKTAVAFAHTGLLFVMARTPDAPVVKEIKPAAMIGYADISMRSIQEHGRQVLRYAPQSVKLEGTLRLRQDPKDYQERGKLEAVVVDTGENGLFARGEFEAITAINQMEFITPEEIASKVVLEIRGVNTGADIISALDSTVLDPTFRAGNLRRAALEELARLEGETGVPSIALGQLGPPELSKLLFEAYLLRQRYHTLERVLKQRPRKIAEALHRYILKHEELAELIVSVGVPILLPDGETLLRGPYIHIPERLDRDEVTVSARDIDAWARKGWVDLRPTNMARWRERMEQMERARKSLRGRGSSAVTEEAYLFEEIHIGEVAAWIFNNEEGGYRIK